MSPQALTNKYQPTQKSPPTQPWTKGGPRYKVTHVQGYSPVGGGKKPKLVYSVLDRAYSHKEIPITRHHATATFDRQLAEKVAAQLNAEHAAWAETVRKKPRR